MIDFVGCRRCHRQIVVAKMNGEAFAVDANPDEEGTIFLTYESQAIPWSAELIERYRAKLHAPLLLWHPHRCEDLDR